MKAEDLMIGNYLFKEGVIVKIDARTIFDICNDEEFKKYKPIHLNESELERLGVDVKGFDKRKFCRTLSKDGVKFRISNSGHIYHGKRFIPDVHTAQNLFKSLTGKQLVYLR